MAFNISWYVENRVILADVTGVVDMNEMNSSNTAITQLLDKGAAPVHLLVNTTELKQFPTNVGGLRKSLAYLAHPNIGWIIVINTNPLLNFLAHIVTSIVNAKSRTVKTFEEGKQLLLILDNSVTT